MPALARVEQQGTAKRIAFAGLRLEISQDRTRERITEPRRVGEDVANGRWSGCRPQPIGTSRRVERCKYLEICKLRQIFFNRIIETQAALLDELHGRHRCDRLGHGSDAE